MCIRDGCDLDHPTDMMCGQALSLFRKGWLLVMAEQVAKTLSRNEYMKRYMRAYRAKKKASKAHSVTVT